MTGMKIYNPFANRRRTAASLIMAALLFVLAVFAIWQAIMVNTAHSSFENYYAFRGCTQLISRTDTYGLCRTNSGTTIKMVKNKGKWYLDGDLPVCVFHGAICI